MSEVAGNARTKVSEHLGINKGTEIMALIPALSTGTYTLEIVTQYTRGGAALKDPRTIKAESVLTEQ